jgi:pyruvate dehydrogenase E2 component (dihydrolipoamide acetyltransferase)
MANAILMPRMSDSMVEGTLTKWLKKEGDVLKSGDLIAEIETDKATQEVECFEAGVLLKQTVVEGGVVPVGGPICVIGKPGEDISGMLAQAAQDTSVQSSKVKAEATTKAADEKRAPVAPPSEASAPTTPVQPVIAAEFKNSARGAVIETQAMDDAADKGEIAGRLRASPLARKIAAEKGVSLYNVKGTGPGGRITVEDVQGALEGKSGRAPLAPVEGGSPSFAGAALREGVDQKIPLTNMRKTIARRLQESKQQVPHFYSTIEIDAEPLTAFRQQLNTGLAATSTKLKLSVNDLVLKAVALAAKEVPEVNAAWEGDSITRFAAVHVSFAVSLPTGLITPVVRDADIKPLKQVAFEAKELGKRAKEKGLKPDEFTGGTITVSNLGMFGVDSFQAIVNPPQAVIVAVASIIEKPVVKDGQIVVGHTMKLTVSGDHRAVDGSDGARFLVAMKNILENPTLLVL